MGTSEMSDQIDQLNKIRQKVEKEKHAKRLQIDEVRGASDNVANEKATLEKQNRLLDQQRVELNRKCEQSNLMLADYDTARKKVVVENADLLHSIEELENNNAVLGKVNQTLTGQLNEQIKIADDESKERSFLLGKHTNLEEESQSKADALRLLSKSVADAQMWRQKYEKDGLAKCEDLESGKLKIQSRLAEAEGAVQNLNRKALALEK